MSCFICDDAHITALAAYAVRHGIADTTRLAALARIHGESLTDVEALAAEMFNENVASFRARYQGRHESDIGSFTFDRETSIKVRVGAFSPIAIIKSAQCFEYQACEHDDWKHSYTKSVINGIISHAITELPGYSAASWGAPDCGNVTPPPAPVAAPVPAPVAAPVAPAKPAPTPKATKRAKPTKRLSKVAFGGRIISRPTA